MWWSYREMEERFKREELENRCSRPPAELKFSKQKEVEVSLRNALFEKSRQIEGMGLASQELLEQLTEIEKSFKIQDEESSESLRWQMEECEKCFAESAWSRKSETS